MNVKELMTEEVITVGPETPLKEVAGILAQRSISGLPVCDDEGRVLGIVSEGDILFKEQGQIDRPGGIFGWFAEGIRTPALEKSLARTAAEAMTAPAIAIRPERPVAAAARMMVEHGVNRLPVVKDGKLVGILTRADLVRAFTRNDLELLTDIREDVLRRALWIDPDLVEVTVSNGEVVLSGELEAKSDVEVLTKLVKRIPGVVSVESKVEWTHDDLDRTGRFAGYR